MGVVGVVVAVVAVVLRCCPVARVMRLFWGAWCVVWGSSESFEASVVVFFGFCFVTR